MRSYTRWRLLRPLLAFVLSVSLLISYIYLKSRPSYELYKSLSEYELEQSRKLVRNSRQNKYVLFKQLQGAGFNNQAQEILLFHHLALLTSRVYVYQPLIWRPRGENSMVPLSAFLEGVTRESVSAAVFDEACPPEDIKHVQVHVNNGARWEYVKKILNGPEKCIIVDQWILTWDYLASQAIHDIWPSFKNYLSNHFHWSKSIQAIADRASSALNLRPHATSSFGDPYIALHLRRGDFENHCHGLADDRIGFTTWATLPTLQSSILAPALDSTNGTSIFEHCYPTLERIISAIDTYARAKPHLRTIHILHDGAWDHPLVYVQHFKLESALKDAVRARTAGWINGPMRRVTHSGKVPVKWGEADWAVTVDVELARRAEVFIGNGFSSLSTQVVALRLGADGGRTEDITFL
ncbi:hypothetical protein BDZ94DRAFT_1219994 [Collybia nuda]|uniref:O-fucosyltransferase family protein n=1 Tax=Collybia nuda TaxID=64659 RepID=A0A9P5Y5Z8_9AGAR|nr:hypothetical protein BDZ94DRAFT_1219994 [Collybia nuda]